MIGTIIITPPPIAGSQSSYSNFILFIELNCWTGDGCGLKKVKRIIFEPRRADKMVSVQSFLFYL